MKKYVAEFIGTMLLVTLGCGSAAAANTLLGNAGQGLPLAYSTLLISFAFGLSMIAMAYSIGNVSGCHINPAVSLAMLIVKRMNAKEFVGYTAAQILGGIAGAVLLCVCFGGNAALGTNGFGEASALGVGAGVAFLVETVLSFVFLLAILGVASKPENGSAAGLVIGFTFVLIHLLGTPFTGTGANPARSLGPALLAGGRSLRQVWLFIAAPLAGAALAAAVHTFITSDN